MSIRLQSGDLNAIEKVLESLNALGVHVRSVEVKGHIIYLDHEQSTHFVVGIELKKDQPLNQSKPGGPWRGISNA